MFTDFFKFLERQGLLSPDPSVGAVVANIQEIGHFIYERKVCSQVRFYMLEKNLLYTGLIHGVGLLSGCLKSGLLELVRGVK
jgi:hypothetical protein